MGSQDYATGGSADRSAQPLRSALGTRAGKDMTERECGGPLGLTDDEIRARLDDWFGEGRVEYSPALINGIQAFTSMPWQERETAVSALKAFFCIHCGSETIGCQCWNDE